MWTCTYIIGEGAHYAASARENKLRGLSGGKESFDILFYTIYFHLPQAIQENVHANIMDVLIS